MNRRRFVVIAAVLVLLTVIVNGALIYRTEPAPFVRAFAQLKLGMTKDEVSTVMGQPPAAWFVYQPYRGGPKHIAGRALPDQEIRHPIESELWRQDKYLVYVAFDRDGRAVSLTVSVFRDPTFFERIREWLGCSGETP